MTHCSDEDLILHYYGEDATPAAHLAACATCAGRYRELEAMLQALFSVEVPGRGDQYGLEVWQRIRPRLPEPEPWWHALLGYRQIAAVAAAAVILVVAGFAAGRLWTVTSPAAVATRTEADDEAARRRVLLLTVADHLERSERMLTDIMNASAGADISLEQQWAADLMAASRLYRQDALDTNETSVASVLDELERTLVDIVHHPATASAADLESMRRRIDSAALLFKVRVVTTELRGRELGASDPDTRQPRSTSTIG
jgi:hypothetical protein